MDEMAWPNQISPDLFQKCSIKTIIASDQTKFEHSPHICLKKVA